MKQKIIGILAAFFLILALQPAQAGTWRSTSGNIFHFYPGGSMEAYINGSGYSGQWWWTESPYWFQYSVDGWNGCGTVGIKGDGAIARWAGRQPTYWTQLGSRGGKMAQEDTKSWFTTQVDP